MKLNTGPVIRVSFLKRLAAYFLDGVLIALISYFIRFILSAEIINIPGLEFGNKVLYSYSDISLTTYNFGNYAVKISSAEKAAMELCYDVPKTESFDELDQIISGLTTLRPRLIQELLEKCQSVKTKRLFMYLAEKHDHAWVKKLDLGKVHFGKGKRSLCRNGRYDDKYKIVVPK